MSDMHAFHSAVRQEHAAKKIALARGSVSSEQARLSRLLRRGMHTGPNAAGTATSFELQMVDEATTSRADRVLTLTGPFGEIECADGVRFLRALTGIDIGGAGRDNAHRAWLEAAIIGRLAGTPLSCVTGLSDRSLGMEAQSAVLRMTLRSDSHALTIHARARIQTWFAFLQNDTWTPVRAPAEKFSDLPFHSRIRLARHKLPSSMLRTLGPGDILIPDSLAFDCNGNGFIRLGNLSARVRYEAPSFLHILSAEVNLKTHEPDDPYDDDYFDDEDHLDEESKNNQYRVPDDSSTHDHDDHQDLDDDQYQKDLDEEADHATAEELPSQDAGVTDSAEQASATDNVPVRLEFELGKVRLTLGALRTLASGSVLTVEDGSPDRIVIRSGDRTLGYGEAVDVAGKLGIRIIDWRA